jgi:polar amino acid transport system ATP-binding protein
MNEGEVLSIIGSSEAENNSASLYKFFGKTDEGQILVKRRSFFDARNKNQLSISEQRKNQLNFGLVFQSFNLFPQYNVLENVELAPKLLAKERNDYKENKKEILASIESEARAVLERVGLSDKLANYPCELSAASSRELSIARALALKPKVLFFDEPTSALDPELTGEILKVYAPLRQKR